MVNARQVIRYKTEARQLICQGKTITITHKTPILTDEQREMIKREIGHGLFKIFNKYKNNC